MIKTKKGKIFILSGPSGSGKTTIHERILKSPKLKRKVVCSVSITTRDPRSGERQGHDYFFISKKMFEYKIRAGHFLEWAKVFGNYYGTSAKHVRNILNSGKSVLLCIDIQGAKQVMRSCKEAVTIFVQAPSFSELKRRLSKRGTETPKDLKRRLNIAKKEIQQRQQYDYVVVNQQLSIACQNIEDIIYNNIV